MSLRAQGLEAMTEFDDISIPILPLIERGEIIADGVDRRQGRGQPRSVVHCSHMGLCQRSTSGGRTLGIIRNRAAWHRPAEPASSNPGLQQLTPAACQDERKNAGTQSEDAIELKAQDLYVI